MSRIDTFEALSIHKTIMRGSLAAAAPGLVAMVAAATATRSTLLANTGMTGIGVAALGVVFFCLAFIFARGRWWAGLPGLFFAGWAMWVFGGKIARLLSLFYQYNPIQTFGDVVAPLPVVSLQACLVIISLSLALVIIKTIRLCHGRPPKPVSRFAWGALALWLTIVVWEGYIHGPT